MRRKSVIPSKTSPAKKFVKTEMTESGERRK